MMTAKSLCYNVLIEIICKCIAKKISILWKEHPHIIQFHYADTRSNIKKTCIFYDKSVFEIVLKI